LLVSTERNRAFFTSLNLQANSRNKLLARKSTRNQEIHKKPGNPQETRKSTRIQEIHKNPGNPQESGKSTGTRLTSDLSLISVFH
jgi:hypothetical protein